VEREHVAPGVLLAAGVATAAADRRAAAGGPPSEQWMKRLRSAGKLPVPALVEEKIAPDSGFHVATGGDDANPGTRERPFATVARVRDAVRALKSGGLKGDVLVSIRGGQFRDPGRGEHVQRHSEERHPLSQGRAADGARERDDALAGRQGFHVQLLFPGHDDVRGQQGGGGEGTR
jgi:hypothetical protein